MKKWGYCINANDRKPQNYCYEMSKKGLETATKSVFYQWNEWKITVFTTQIFTKNCIFPAMSSQRKRQKDNIKNEAFHFTNVNHTNS